MNSDQKLKNLLEKKVQFLDESGEIDKNKVINKALVAHKDLIRLLIKDKHARDNFFLRIDDYWVFEINKFVDYLSDKNLFAGSYTKFKNKIGLNVNGKYLNERGEVSLVWPFKDCVLEGGMTKEDQKRNEIFFNEILAKDEIDRLYDAKVLTNFKKYTAKGEEKVKDLNRDEKGTIKDNLIIKGNNLLALHSLKKEFSEKVKLIYIDPPYNTGGDSFGYNDNFNHSSWLTFMKNRLEVARDLLKEDGIIFVQCDDNEQAYLKVLMDEVFRNNLISNSIVVINRGGRDYGGIARTHEYLLAYSKNNFKELNPIEDKEKKFDYFDEISGFNLMELRNRNILFNDKNRPNLCYPFYVNPNKKDKNGLLEISLEIKKGFVKIMPLKSQGVQTVWRWGKEKALENLNKEIKGKEKNGGGYMIVQKYRKTTKRQRSVWDEKEFVNERGTEHLKKLFNGKVFSYPKSEYLMSRIIELGSNEGDIVLDYHLGSGTTCSASHKMNRQYIGIEQMNYINEVTVERLKKVIFGKDVLGISESVDWKGGGEFIYCELLKYNEEAIDKIQDAKDTKSLLKIWDEMCEHYFLNYDVKIKKFNDNKKDFEKLTLKQQKDTLVGMLNKNQLYVNLSEIEDSQFKVSKEDKELNKKFYEGK
jgi:adenine-specific DNA-methyltransferase